MFVSHQVLQVASVSELNDSEIDGESHRTEGNQPNEDFAMSLVLDIL